MAIEFDDQALKIIGNNVKALRFFDNSRVLRAEIFLDGSNRLNIGSFQVGGGADGGAASDLTSVPFLALGSSPALTAERILSISSGLTGVDGGPNESFTISLNTPGTLSATSTNTAAGNHKHTIDSTIARSAIQIIAGDGLTGGGNLTTNRTINVAAADTSMTINADSIQVRLATISGLVVSSGLSVGAGAGITVNANDVALTTPGTLSVSSANNATGNHTHGITSSSNPGAAALILASNADGYLRLVRIGLGKAPTLPLDVDGNAAVSGNVGIGIVTAAAKLHSFATTEQLRLGYDASNYVQFTVNSGGAAVITPTGAYVELPTNKRLQFRDSGQVVHSTTANQLDIDATTEIEANAPTIQLIASTKVAVSGAGTNLLEVDGNIQLLGSRSIVTSGGSTNLTIAPVNRLDLIPAGNQVRIGDNATLRSENYASQVSGFGIISGVGSGDFRYLYTDELHAKAFVADLEQALAGGQIISKSVAPLAADFTVPAAGGSADMTVESFIGFPSFQVFVNGDIVRVRTFDRSGGGLIIADAWGTVTFDSLDTDEKTQTWNFTRSTAPNAGTMTASTVVPRGSLVLDYGTSGNGFIEANAIDGAMGVNSPYSQIVTWATHPATGQQVRTRTGNLHGITAQTGEFGLFAGNGVLDTDKYLRISSHAFEIHNVNLKLFDSGTPKIQLNFDEGVLVSSGTWGTDTTTFGAVYKNNAAVSGFDANDVLIGRPFHSNESMRRGLHWDNSSGQLFVKGGIVVGNGTGVVVPGASLFCRFDGPRPYETDYQVNTTGHLGQVATVSGSIIGRPGRFGKAAQIAQAVTNMITNPVFEINTTGWAANDLVTTLTRTTDNAWIGTASLRVSSSDTTTSIQASLPAALTITNQPYTLAAAIKNESVPAAGDIVFRFRWSGGVNAALNYDVTVSSVSALGDGWNRLSASMSPDFSDRTGLLIYIRATGITANGQSFLVDGVDVTATSHPTPHANGSLGAGHSWAGTANDSPSARIAASLAYPVAGNVSPTRGTWMAWVKLESSLTGAIRVILDARDGSNANAPALYVASSGDLVWFFAGAIRINYAGFSPAAGQWRHVAITYDFAINDHRLFVDGIQVGTSTFSATPSFGANLHVGKFNFDANRLNGYIDELTILDFVASADLIRSVAESDLPIAVGTSPFEILLTRQDAGRVYGNADGLFGRTAIDAPAFALSTRDNLAWGSTTLQSGGVMIGSDAASQSNVLIQSGTISLRSQTTTHVSLSSTGVVLVGREAAGQSNVQITSGEIKLRNNTTDHITLSSTGVVIVGREAVSQNNVHITAGQIHIRNNTTQRISMTAAGVLTIKNSSGNAVFTFNTTAGAEFTLPLTLGSGGGIFQGTGTFASPTTGLKIWNDSGIGRLATYSSSVLQVGFNTSGQFTAGAGAVRLDENGIHIEPATLETYDSPTSIEMGPASVGRDRAYIRTWYSTALNASNMTLAVKNSAGSTRTSVILGHDSILYLSAVSHVRLDTDLRVFGTDDIRVGGGIAVGSTSTDPPVGRLHLSASSLNENSVTWDTGATPPTPGSGTQMRAYYKSNKFIIQYNDGGTVRYKYLDLTGTGVTWVHTTTAP